MQKEKDHTFKIGTIFAGLVALVFLASKVVDLNSADNSFMSEQFKVVRRFDDLAKRGLASAEFVKQLQVVNKVANITRINVESKAENLVASQAATSEQGTEAYQAPLKFTLFQVVNVHRYNEPISNLQVEGADDYASSMMVDGDQVEELTLVIPAAQKKLANEYELQKAVIDVYDIRFRNENGDKQVDYKIDGIVYGPGILQIDKDVAIFQLAKDGPYAGTRFIFYSEDRVEKMIRAAYETKVIEENDQNQILPREGFAPADQQENKTELNQPENTQEYDDQQVQEQDEVLTDRALDEEDFNQQESEETAQKKIVPRGFNFSND